MSATLAHHGINVVNDLFLGDTRSSGAACADVSAPVAGMSPDFGASSAHARIHSNIFDQACRMAQSFDPALKPRDCFSDVCGGVDYLGKATSAVPLDLKKLSLASVEPRDLSGLLGPSGESIVERFSISCVLQMDMAKAREVTGLARPYLDPSLRKSTGRYHSFIRKLWSRGMLGCSFDVACSVGVFAVAKKGKFTQRMVIDCRLANAFFSEPEPTSLPTTAAFSNIHLFKDESLH